jgi:hypothetical protein
MQVSFAKGLLMVAILLISPIYRELIFVFSFDAL